MSEYEGKYDSSQAEIDELNAERESQWDDEDDERDDHTEDAGCWCGGGCDPLNT